MSKSGKIKESVDTPLAPVTTPTPPSPADVEAAIGSFQRDLDEVQRQMSELLRIIGDTPRLIGAAKQDYDAAFLRSDEPKMQIATNVIAKANAAFDRAVSDLGKLGPAVVALESHRDELRLAAAGLGRVTVEAVLSAQRTAARVQGRMQHIDQLGDAVQRLKDSLMTATEPRIQQSRPAISAGTPICPRCRLREFVAYRSPTECRCTNPKHGNAFRFEVPPKPAPEIKEEPAGATTTAPRTRPKCPRCGSRQFVSDDSPAGVCTCRQPWHGVVLFQNGKILEQKPATFIEQSGPLRTSY